MAVVERAHRRHEPDRAGALRRELFAGLGDRPDDSHAGTSAGSRPAMRAVASARTTYSSSSSGRSARIDCEVALDGLPVAARDRAGQLEAESIVPRISGSSASGGAPAASSSDRRRGRSVTR